MLTDDLCAVRILAECKDSHAGIDCMKKPFGTASGTTTLGCTSVLRSFGIGTPAVLTCERTLETWEQGRATPNPQAAARASC